MIIVSACLAGLKCRYDGNDNACEKVIDLVRQGEAIPLCSEQLGGLPTPRKPAERVGEKVKNEDGTDVTSQFCKGAEEVLKVAKMTNCKKAILKANSPSCGSGTVYDGTFSGNYTQGDGILAELLKANGIKIISEKDIECHETY